MRFHDSKLKFVKALSFRSFHETEAPAVYHCLTIICGRAYSQYFLFSLGPVEEHKTLLY